MKKKTNTTQADNNSTIAVECPESTAIGMFKSLFLDKFHPRLGYKLISSRRAFLFLPYVSSETNNQFKLNSMFLLNQAKCSDHNFGISILDMFGIHGL